MEQSKAIRNQQQLLRFLAVCHESIFRLLFCENFAGKNELLKALKEIFLNITNLTLKLRDPGLQDQIVKREKQISVLIHRGEKKEAAGLWNKERKLVQAVLKDVFSDES